MYDMGVHSICYLKWCQFVNRLPLDNAILKFQFHGVS